MKRMQFASLMSMLMAIFFAILAMGISDYPVKAILDSTALICLAISLIAMVISGN